MVNKMKKTIKKIVLPLIFSILIGMISGNLVYRIYQEKIETELTQNRVFLLEYGEYDTIENLNSDKYNSKYLYFLDHDNNYTKVLGITKNEDNIEKISSIYEEELLIHTYYLNNDELNEKINHYDEQLSKASTKEEIEQIVDETMELYKNEDNNILAKR